jgi:hypothetical protein
VHSPSAQGKAHAAQATAYAGSPSYSLNRQPKLKPEQAAKATAYASSTTCSMRRQHKLQPAQPTAHLPNWFVASVQRESAGVSV